MSLLTPEQIAATQKANLETLFGLTNRTFACLEKLVALNLAVVKSTVAESQDNALKALAVKDPHELVALQVYLTRFPDMTHDALEDRIYEKLLGKDALPAEFDQEIEAQHTTLGRQDDELLQDSESAVREENL
ncbi:hypothetical protein PTKU46_80740 [Paraburkholderia terrae]|uniref:phasin family protein n=1 Tax=Paraburkholderia terrae TaxID=311230 RepID=UPI0030DE6490